MLMRLQELRKSCKTFCYFILFWSKVAKFVQEFYFILFSLGKWATALVRYVSFYLNKLVVICTCCLGYLCYNLVVWVCLLVSVKWLVGKTGFLHQSSGWLGGSSLKWPVKRDIKPHSVYLSKQCGSSQDLGSGGAHVVVWSNGGMSKLHEALLCFRQQTLWILKTIWSGIISTSLLTL